MSNCTQNIPATSSEKLEADLARYGAWLNCDDHTVELVYKGKVIGHFTTATFPDIIRGFLYEYLERNQ